MLMLKLLNIEFQEKCVLLIFFLLHLKSHFLFFLFSYSMFIDFNFFHLIFLLYNDIKLLI